MSNSDNYDGNHASSLELIVAFSGARGDNFRQEEHTKTGVSLGWDRRKSHPQAQVTFSKSAGVFAHPLARPMASGR